MKRKNNAAERHTHSKWWKASQKFDSKKIEQQSHEIESIVQEINLSFEEEKSKWKLMNNKK